MRSTVSLGATVRERSLAVVQTPTANACNGLALHAQCLHRSHRCPSIVSQSATKPPLLEVRKLVKSFGELRANDEIDLSVQPGEIHALLGENGAGKSTLVKMLYGSLRPDSGEVRLHGQACRINSPAAARGLGIGMVFQHFSLFDALCAAENIALSLDAGARVSDIAHQVGTLSAQYGLPLDPSALVGDLSVGERQRIEIIRCLLQRPELIILDEPTSVLTPQEAQQLFKTLVQLRDEGKSILYISHRLEEVKQLCDRATVLRHGQVVATCNPREETAGTLARMMVGVDIERVSRARGRSGRDAAGEILLELSHLERSAASPFSIAIRDVSLQVRAGSIVGIAGVAGNGQSELFETLSGEVRAADKRMVRIADKDVGHLGISARRRLGAAFVPEERLGHATVPDHSLWENLLLSRHATDTTSYLGFGGWVKRQPVETTTRRIMADMDVRASGVNAPAARLSGGNLQKFVVGRELDRAPKILVINQPTWGVDANAAARIRNALVALAGHGCAVLLISQDLDELQEVCDWLCVMHDGSCSAPLQAGTASAEQIGLLMGGAA